MANPSIRITWQLSNKYRIDENNEESVPLSGLSTIKVPKIERKRAKWLLTNSLPPTISSSSATAITDHLRQLFRNAEALDSEDTNILERAYKTCTSRHSIRIRYSDRSFLSAASSTSTIANSIPPPPSSSASSSIDQELQDYYEESGRPVPPRLISTAVSSSSSPSISSCSSFPFPSSCTVIRCGLRKFTPLVHWESPLAAANRAEGLIMVYPPGYGWNPSSSSSSGEDQPPYIFRCSPVDIQEFITHLFTTLRTENAKDNANGIAPSPDELIRIPHSASVIPSSGSSSSSIPSDLSTRYFIQAEMEKQAYIMATSGILVQRRRVEHGGELWTKEEKQARLDRLKIMVDQISRELSQKVHESQHQHHPRSSSLHGHSHDHPHSTSSSATVSKITDLSQALSNIATLTTDIAQNTVANSNENDPLLSSTVLQLSYNELAQIAMDNLTDVQKSILEAYDKGYNEVNAIEQ